MEGTKLVIDRQKWLHGEDSTVSYLLRQADGKMCCMGFYCLMLGLANADIEQVRMPSEVDFSDMPMPAGLKPLVGTCDCDFENCQMSSELANELGVINDAVIGKSGVIHSEGEREGQLAALFKAHLGVEVEFVN